MSGPTSPQAFGEAGRRDTRQRRALRERLAASDTFVSAQQLHRDLRSGDDKVGLATVYRTLQAMASAGEIDAIRTVDGETLYRKCGQRHHHHLVCRGCGLTVELEGPGVETWAARSADAHGFTGVEHVVELFGDCADCSRA